ncbi:MAG: cytidine deaminase [Chitinophagales bacterium]|nr:cytidine deaminase [Chitinophagales bacterium]
MEERSISFNYKVFKSREELPSEDAALLQKATVALEQSYSPYSNFKVAAAVLLANGEIVTGSNQENAAFPAGICAEGTVLSAASSLYADVAIVKIAITVKSHKRVIETPVAPCGICRQRLLEYENRFNQSIQIILAGEKGEVFVIDSVKHILPLYFSKNNL